MRQLPRFVILTVLLHLTVSVHADELAGGALAGERPRVIVSTDVGGSDPDDFQSMVHLLMYADVLDIEGLISSPPNAGRAKHLHECLDAYAEDFGKLKRASSRFPTPACIAQSGQTRSHRRGSAARILTAH